MSRWPQKKLFEIAQVMMGQSPPGETYNARGEGLPFFQGKAEFGDVYPTPGKWCSEPLKIAEPGDILLSVRAPVGPTNIVHVKSCIGRGLAAIRANQGLILPSLLLYFFKAYEQSIAQLGVGSTFNAIGKDDIGNLEIPVPPLSHQEQIVGILNESDHLRRLRAEAVRRTADLIPATFYEMFGNPPKTWPVAKFGDLGTLDRGRSKHRPRDEANLFGGPYPFIQTGDIANSGGCVEAYAQTYSELGLSQSKLWPERTLCITIAANIAKCAVLSFPACFPDSVVGFIPNELIIVEFAQSWLETLQAKLEDEAPQAAQKNINLQTLRNLELRVPPVELQRTFAVRVAEIRAMGAEQAASRRRLDDLFQSLLHRAFQGEL